MTLELSEKQLREQEQYRNFVDQEIIPFANEYDQEERTPAEVIRKLALKGYLGTTVPAENGGTESGMISHGLLCEEIGRGSASLLSLITVHGMVSQALLKWGNPHQREHWLPKLAKGEVIGAFGLTEPSVGSDAKSIESTAVSCEDGYVLNGAKKWISFGQAADIFIIMAQCEGKPSAFLIERNTPGFSVKPITGMLGFRSAMLAELRMEDCTIPKGNLVGAVGFGFSHVCVSALDYGRYCIAWGCTGLAQACLEACLQYTSTRKQGGSYLRSYQLIQQMIAEMTANIKAARLLCHRAGFLKDRGEPESIMETSIAKYFAARIVNAAATDAVQMHGANGCSSDYPVQRYLRDAKIMEIIEGSTQIQQIIISKYAYLNYVSDRRKEEKVEA